MYDDPQYAESRLAQTIVRKEDGDPVTVEGVFRNDDGEIICNVYDHRVKLFKHQPLNRLNLKPMPLGYINSGAFPSYLSRRPRRQDWRQGLRRANLSSGRFLLEVTSLPQIFLDNIIDGKYPKISTVLRRIRAEQVFGNAFSRSFAIVDGSYQREPLELHYQNRIVGTVSPDGVPTLTGNNTYLTERLEHDYGKAN